MKQELIREAHSGKTDEPAKNQILFYAIKRLKSMRCLKTNMDYPTKKNHLVDSSALFVLALAR